MSANVLLTESINMEVSGDIELPWYYAMRDSSCSYLSTRTIEHLGHMT